MTLLKNTNTLVIKSSPNTKIAVVASIKKAVPTLKKPADTVKKPIVSSTMIKGKTVSSPLKSPSISEKSSLKVTPVKPTVAISAIKTPSPSLKKSTATLSAVSSVNKATIGEKEGKPNVTKSILIKTPQRKLEDTKKETPVRSADKLSPVSKIRSKTTSPTISKSTNAKLPTTPVKSISPVRPKMISSPSSKLNVVREIKPSTFDKSKEVKSAKTVPNSLTKKSFSPTKLAPVKITKAAGGVAKLDDGAKIKPKLLIKKSPLSSPVTLKNSSAVKTSPKVPITAISITVDKTNQSVTPEIGKISDLCTTGVNVDKCDTPLISEHTTDNEFDVVQAFKVAEQLIRIQSTDSNLETVVETSDRSTVNWDEVITPCVGPIDSTHDEIQADEDNRDDETVQVSESLNYLSASPAATVVVADISIACDDPEELVSECQPNSCINAEIESNLGIGEVSTADTLDVRKENDNFGTDFSTLNDDTTEWTIVIDEFSADRHKPENQHFTNASFDKTENTSMMPYKTFYEDSVSLTYADVLKKIPKILANSTNVQPCKKELNLNMNLEIKEYHLLKKVEALYTTNILFNKIEKDIKSTDYENDNPAEPEYAVARKKYPKKMKHSSKRYLKNIHRDFEYVDHAEIFITPVWKNIY